MASDSDALLTAILDRLDDYPLPGDAAALLLAALEGEEVLRARLGGSSDAGVARPAPDRAASEPAGA